ncbi:MAG: DUF4332 domain-containing protein [Verrucomicrobiota bacterium]
MKESDERRAAHASGKRFERVRGDASSSRRVASEYADVLEAAGADSVPELARRNPANPADRPAKANAEKNLVRALAGRGGGRALDRARSGTRPGRAPFGVKSRRRRARAGIIVR